jgi:hypothetical protein
MKTIYKILFERAIVVLQKGTIVTLCIILIALFMTTSCEKKETPQITSEEEYNTPKISSTWVIDSISQQKILGKWKLEAWYNDTAIDIDKDGNASTDLMSQWNGCWKHSVLEFSEESEYAKIIYIGADNNPECHSGIKTNDFYHSPPWRIRQTNYQKFSELVFQGDDYQDPYEILELSDETLILKNSGFLTCCNPDISYYTKGYLKFIRVE